MAWITLAAVILTAIGLIFARVEGLETRLERAAFDMVQRIVVLECLVGICPQPEDEENVGR